jgi:hypothetical protein
MMQAPQFQPPDMMGPGGAQQAYYAPTYGMVWHLPWASLSLFVSVNSLGTVWLLIIT